MDKVYVLMWATGEYLDRAEGTVCAFTKYEDAADAVREAEVWSFANKVAMSQEAEIPDYNEREEIGKACPFGPVYIEYTGIRWYVMPVPLREGR